jgi:hypothetical protein
MSRTVAFPHTSTAESLRFTTLVALPNLAEGLFSRRPRVTAALNRVGVARRAHRLLTALHRRYGDGPIWVNVGGKQTLLVFGPDQIRFVLSHAPKPFASDPEPKLSDRSAQQTDLHRHLVWDAPVDQAAAPRKQRLPPAASRPNRCFIS